VLIVPASFRTHHSPLESGLRLDGKRMTPQRKKVLSLFEEIGSGIHLSAEEVHSKLTSSGEKVSLATIYRTLRLLVKMTFLNELDLSEGGNRFELLSHDHPDHHHLICIRCGRTEEFENNEVINAGEAAAKKFGFKLLESSLNVRALCPMCKNK